MEYDTSLSLTGTNRSNTVHALAALGPDPVYEVYAVHAMGWAPVMWLMHVYAVTLFVH